MLRMSRRFDLGLLIMSHLARRGHDGASAREIAERFDISRSFVANILKSLSHNQLVTSFRGVNGGYVLNKDPAEISMLDLVLALEGPFAWAMCSTEHTETACGCDLEPICPISGPIKGLHERIEDVLRQTTVAELVQDEPRKTAEVYEIAHLHG